MFRINSQVSEQINNVFKFNYKVKTINFPSDNGANHNYAIMQP